MRAYLPHIAAISALVIVIIILLQPNGTSTNTQTTGPLNVVASFYPIAEFATAVGGDAVIVTTITPPGTEPHEYEPTSQEIAAMYNADLFLYNGSGVDAWADRIATDVQAHNIAVLNMSDVVSRIGNDPHFWLDPLFAQQEVEAISALLTTIQPAQASLFARNASAYIKKLEALHADYQQGLTDCAQRTIITSHDAFAYLAQEYTFTVQAITGLSPEEEPSAGRLAEIAQMAKEQQIKYIYFETLVSPKLAQTIAREVGAQTLVFNPLEGLTTEETASGKNYLTVMKENLQNLRTGMLCR